MTPELKEKLRSLADKYENEDFPNADPSQFLRWYDKDKDGLAAVEAASFIAAMLAFGNRKLFIPKIKEILTQADNFKGGQTPQLPVIASEAKQPFISWLMADAPSFPRGSQKFYRFYSYDDMHCLFQDLAEIIRQFGSLGEALRSKYQEGTDPSTPRASEKDISHPCENHTSHPCEKDTPRHCEKDTSHPCEKDTPRHCENQTPRHCERSEATSLADSLSSLFPNSTIVPKGKTSANKRIYMYLRWMVRKNSPVDLGLWTWANPADLLIPLDVHVMQEAIGLGLLPENASASRKTARVLTSAMEEVFPGDPARADFALFGLGIDDKI
ncbi:MAG: DUF2400 domain-containing protein [Treponema sp.]|nr:DUF2400 domain-containing protein [Treponema sp.]